MTKTKNYVELQGTVTRDAEQRSPKAPFRFSLATGGEDKPNGEGKYPQSFHNITAWPGKFPDAATIRAPMPVRVSGRLNYTAWTDKDGIERTGVEIVASQIIIDPETEVFPESTE